MKLKSQYLKTLLLTLLTFLLGAQNSNASQTALRFEPLAKNQNSFNHQTIRDGLAELEDLFSGYTQLSQLPGPTKTFLSAKNWDNALLTKLDEDLVDTAFKNSIKTEPQLFEAWEIVSTGSEALRRNPTNLEKLNDFVSATGMEKSKLISSFGNAKNPQKWLDMKIPESNLDALYDGFKNSPPSKFDAWTPDHKAQRWANHKKGNPNADFKTWSNKYDGNIDKANFAHNGVNDYFDALNWGCPLPPCRERLIPNITAVVDGKVITGGRRLDIADVQARKAKEFKEYSSGKVYNSADIRREVAMDEELLLDGDLFDEIEWVFKGCTPSGPLEKALIDAGILIKLEP